MAAGLLAWTALAFNATPAQAQGFAAYITPPRFEIRTQPGQTLREVFEIQHVGVARGAYRIYTNDWVFRPDNTVVFSDELAPDSCRPWVSIERRELTLEPGARFRFRFEISPPPDTPPRECRFAIMVEGKDLAQSSVQAGGRIGVIVYAAIGTASAALEIKGHRVVTWQGKATPTLEIHNSGNAHGRLEGFLSATDTTGHRFELSPVDLPILAGETRTLALNPVAEGVQPAPPIRYPLKVKGELEWGNRRLPLDMTFAP